jgi:hypothetical protein
MDESSVKEYSKNSVKWCGNCGSTALLPIVLARVPRYPNNSKVPARNNPQLLRHNLKVIIPLILSSNQKLQLRSIPARNVFVHFH